MTKKKKQKNKEKSLFHKAVNFIKYHNAFTIGLVLVVLVSGSAMASEGVRDAVIGEKITEQKGVDNTVILSVDIDNFDFQMEIKGVTEDEQNYYVEYSYDTIAIQDNIWQQVAKAGILTVSKKALAGKDLGLYISEELGEIIDNQFSYLKEVQEIENQKGITLVQETTKYNGLVGLVMNTKTRELPGYEPVIEARKPQAVAYVEPEVVEQKVEPELQLPQTEIEPNNDQPTGGSPTSTEPEPEPEPEPETEGNPSSPDDSSESSQSQTDQTSPDGSSSQDIEGEPVATTTEPVATTTEPVATSTEPACEPTEETCDGTDNNCDGQIDEDCDCGITTCDSFLNLIGECQNPCLGSEGCGVCEPTCSCAEGWTDCDSDMSNGCEIQGECVVEEPEPVATSTEPEMID